MSYAENMAVVVRVKRRFANVPAEGLVIFKHQTDANTFTNPIVPVIAKLISTVNSVEDNIARYLSIALNKKEVKDKLKQVTYHDVLVRACQEAKEDSQYWKYQLAAEGCIHHLDTEDLVEFKKKTIILIDAEDLHTLRPDYLINNDLTSIESIDCVYDIYYSETNTIRKEDTISLHPVFKHELKLHTYKEHKWLNKSKDGDYDKSFIINTIQEVMFPPPSLPLDEVASQLPGLPPAILFSQLTAYGCNGVRDATPGVPMRLFLEQQQRLARIADPTTGANPVCQSIMHHRRYDRGTADEPPYELPGQLIRVSKSAGQPAYQPADQPADQPAGQPSGQPADQPTDQPADQPTDQPADQPAGQPADQPAGQLADQPDGQPTSQPPVQPADQSADQPAGQPADQPVGQLADQPAGQRTSQSPVQPADQSADQPAGQPADQPVGQTTGQPADQPAD